MHMMKLKSLGLVVMKYSIWEIWGLFIVKIIKFLNHTIEKMEGRMLIVTIKGRKLIFVFSNFDNGRMWDNYENKDFKCK